MRKEADSMAMGIPGQESELKAAVVATSLTKFDDVSELDLWTSGPTTT